MVQNSCGCGGYEVGIRMTADRLEKLVFEEVPCGPCEHEGCLDAMLLMCLRLGCQLARVDASQADTQVVGEMTIILRHSVEAMADSIKRQIKNAKQKEKQSDATTPE